MLKVLPVLLLLTGPAFAGDYRDSDDYWFYQQLEGIKQREAAEEAQRQQADREWMLQTQQNQRELNEQARHDEIMRALERLERR